MRPKTTQPSASVNLVVELTETATPGCGRPAAPLTLTASEPLVGSSSLVRGVTIDSATIGFVLPMPGHVTLELMRRYCAPDVPEEQVMTPPASEVHRALELMV